MQIEKYYSVKMKRQMKEWEESERKKQKKQNKTRFYSSQLFTFYQMLLSKATSSNSYTDGGGCCARC